MDTFTNHLENEKSPYLLQHVHNPIDWYPWGEEAFEKAKMEDKPIFLSIGYATCHFCHLMEKESFQNEEIAKLMNEVFVSIKVDREELPEIDNLYMEFAQAMMAGSLGWPLHLILTNELQPFFATTYLPPYSKQGALGLHDLALRIREVWKSEEREDLIEEAEKIVSVFSKNLHVQGSQSPEIKHVLDTAELIYRQADSSFGGMKGAPKFPIAYQYSFLLKCAKLFNESRALFLAELTLDKMQKGGIYDHLGGGFSRYAIDEQWIVPHFEKMLYDNALIANAYLECWQITKKPLYREVVLETLSYVLRVLTHKEGGFYSAEDADSEGKEGFYYTWTTDEIQSLLGYEDSELFCDFYNVLEEGSFEGRNILFADLSYEEYADQTGLNSFDVKQQIEEGRKKLFAAREKRVRPFIDDKLLTSWNGLMIHTMCEAGVCLNHEPFIQAALNAANFIKKNLFVEGQLYRRFRLGEAHFVANLDDYAFLIKGLLTLFEAGLGTEYFKFAIELTNHVDHHFKVAQGAYYQTDGSDSSIILRKCHFGDGAEPSANAIHTENLLRLYDLTGFPEYRIFAEDILKAVKPLLDGYSLGYCYHVSNVARFLDQKQKNLVIALNHKGEYFEELRQVIQSKYIPHKSVIWKKTEDLELLSLIPYLKEMPPINGKTTLYICHNGSCQRPITDISEMLAEIHKL
jgi:uncharacterized protein YyaL (SSP411 family)